MRSCGWTVGNPVSLWQINTVVYASSVGERTGVGLLAPRQPIEIRYSCPCQAWRTPVTLEHAVTPLRFFPTFAAVFHGCRQSRRC